MSATRWKHLHLALTLLWVALAVPSVLWWRNSLAWVVTMSVYACIVGHWSSYQAARAEDDSERNP